MRGASTRAEAHSFADARVSLAFVTAKYSLSHRKATTKHLPPPPKTNSNRLERRGQRSLEIPPRQRERQQGVVVGAVI